MIRLSVSPPAIAPSESPDEWPSQRAVHPRVMHCLADLCCCERLALWTIRCLVTHFRLPDCPETKTTDGLFPVCFRSALDAAEDAFADATYHLLAGGRTPLAVNPPGMQALTPLEHCFLRVVVAAQNDAQREVQSILREVITDPVARGCLVTALTLIADCLAGAGHWLPKVLLNPESMTAGGGALSSVSRWRGVDPSRLRVMWPREEEYSRANRLPR